MIEAAKWLQNPNQPLWDPADLTPEKLRAVIQPSEIFVGYVECDAAVAVFLQSRDPLFWPGVNDALFVHKLSVARRFAGQGYAADMLAWAAEHAKSTGKKFLRLDCAADLPKLRRFYENCEFHFVDQWRLDHYAAARYERRLS